MREDAVAVSRMSARHIATCGEEEKGIKKSGFEATLLYLHA